MNAASQRQLTPWLIAAVSVAAALLLAFAAGLGRGVRWDPPRPPAPLPHEAGVAAPPAAPPLPGFAVVWQQPLFNADRKPSASPGVVAPSLGELSLTGVILTPQLHLAMLHDKQGDRELRVREGSALPDSGWTLVELKPRSAVFSSPAGRTELSLPVTAPAALQAKAGLPPSAPAAAVDPNSSLPPGAMQRQPPPEARAMPPVVSNPDVAHQRERLEALKAAVQRRRQAEAASPSPPDSPQSEH